MISKTLLISTSWLDHLKIKSEEAFIKSDEYKLKTTTK